MLQSDRKFKTPHHNSDPGSRIPDPDFFRSLIPLLLAAPLLATTACSSRSVPKPLEGVPLPLEQRTVEPALWDVEITDGGGLEASRTAFWALPFSIYVDSLNVRDTEISKLEVQYNDLFFPIPLALPLVIDVDEYRYSEPAAEPNGASHVTITPLWAFAGEDGIEPMAREYRALGVPLIFLSAGVTPQDPDGFELDVFSTLWSLGPAGASFSYPKESAEGWAASPLLLGGLLGFTLWPHLDVRTLPTTDPRHVDAQVHGPLTGLLGYRRVVQPEYLAANAVEVAGRQRWSDILGGLVWKESTDLTLENEVQRTAAGVLWTGFGYGIQEGEPERSPRLFWINW